MHTRILSLATFNQSGMLDKAVRVFDSAAAGRLSLEPLHGLGARAHRPAVCDHLLAGLWWRRRPLASGGRHPRGRPAGHHKVGQRDVRGAARLEGNWVGSEVLEHVENGAEPQMLHSTLALATQGHPQVLQSFRY
jgi:hypothetical protein